jgi:AcrR family transcriptional regulator
MSDAAAAASPLRDPRAERSRAALRSALAELLNEQSFESITITSLAARAGVSYATFFRQYADLEALLLDLSRILIEELAALVGASPCRGVAEVATAIGNFAVARRTVLAPLFVGASAALEREILSRATRKAGGSSGLIDSSLPVKLAVSHTVRSVIGVLTWWLQDGRPCSVEVLADLLDRLALRPTSAAAGS